MLYGYNEINWFACRTFLYRGKFAFVFVLLEINLYNSLLCKNNSGRTVFSSLTLL